MANSRVKVAETSAHRKTPKRSNCRSHRVQRPSQYMQPMSDAPCILGSPRSTLVSRERNVAVLQHHSRKQTSNPLVLLQNRSIGRLLYKQYPYTFPTSGLKGERPTCCLSRGRTGTYPLPRGGCGQSKGVSPFWGWGTTSHTPMEVDTYVTHCS